MVAINTPFSSSISAILSGTIGIHYGHVLIHFKVHLQINSIQTSKSIYRLLVCSGIKFENDQVGNLYLQGHKERLKQWVSMGFGLLIIAIVLHFTDGELNFLQLNFAVPGSFAYSRKIWNLLQQFLSISNCTASAMFVSQPVLLE